LKNAVLFLLVRLAPFGAFGLYDWALIRFRYLTLAFNGQENRMLGFVEFYGALLVIPLLILIGGGW
jgi:hypothetical protein